MTVVIAALSPFFARLRRSCRRPSGYALARLARCLRLIAIMTADRSVILLKNNALHERGRRVAGQELRATVQGLPGGAGETRQCR